MSDPGAVCSVNGEERSLADWLGCRLLDYLREGLGATGTKEGCSEGECGACTVLLDGDPVCSCLVLTDTVAGRAVVTVEGIDSALLDRLEAQIDAIGGVQCGFCTPGFMVMAQWIAADAERYDVATLLEGNLCRCTGYVQLHDAILGAVGQPSFSEEHGHDG